MSRQGSEPELLRVRKLALRRAKERKERPTTVHLLAAIAACEGPGAELLALRRLDENKLLKAARSFDEQVADPIRTALNAARDVARRASIPARDTLSGVRNSGARPGPPPPPGGIHVLIVLLSHRHYAGYRALAQCGVDIARLRTSAMQVALGVVATPRRPRTKKKADSRADVSGAAKDSPVQPSKGRGRAVQVPLHATLGRSPRSVEPSRPPVAADSSTPPGTVTDSKTPPSGRASPTPQPKRRRPIKRGSAKGPSDKRPLDFSQLPTLMALGRNLTAAAAAKELDRVVGRQPEIEQALDVLAKRHGNNPVLIGPPGVGKTAVAHGLAAFFADQLPPTVLIELSLNELLVGTGTRGALAERMAAIRQEVSQAEQPVVLFVDEIHELFGAGVTDELSTELKSALADGDLPIIGASTEEGYRKSIEADSALARRFSRVDIPEPDEAEAFLILRAVAEALAAHHGVRYSDEALAVAVAWSLRYVSGRALPDKAVSILDLAGARTRRRQPLRPAKESSDEQLTVYPEQVAEIVSELADVPTERLLQTDGERMLQLEQLLADRVVGHDDALGRIAAVLRRNAAGLRARRPIGTFLLLGPTGVGKTESAKAVAEALFHSPDAMTRLDMSEYAESHAVARLVGAPPGYVGYEAGGLLTEAVRRRPYQVVLLDEIEKAHRDVLESFLQVFDEGRLTDGRGRCVDYTNAVIVMTSNLGADELRTAQSSRAVGFRGKGRSGVDRQGLESIATKAARATLPPELYNRIDEVLFFGPLSREQIGTIATRLIGALAANLQLREIHLDIGDGVVEALMNSGGFEPEYGARPMKRTIGRLIEAPVAEMMLRGELVPGSVALVGVEDGQIALDAISEPRVQSA